MLTFPDGWTTSQPDAADEERTFPSLGDLLARRFAPLFIFWTASPRMTAVRYAQDDGLRPVESCTADALPGWMDDTWLEVAVGLLMGAPSEDDDAPLVAYLDLPIGRVARADVHDDVAIESMYLLSGGDRLHRLVCLGALGATAGWDVIVASSEPVVVDG